MFPGASVDAPLTPPVNGGERSMRLAYHTKPLTYTLLTLGLFGL